MAQPGFIFGENAPDTYESLQAKRKTAERLGLAAMRTPQNLGEGLSSLGQAIAYRRLMGQADRGDAAGRAASDSAFAQIMAGMGGMGGSGPRVSSSGTWSPDAPAPKPTDLPYHGGSALNFPGAGGMDSGVMGAKGDLDFGAVTMTPQEMLIAGAEARNLSPIDLATAMSYETGGTMDPMITGPTTQWGTHQGYIQFGEPQAAEHGAKFTDPTTAMRSQLNPDSGAIWSYLDAAGVKPGMGLEDIYSAINAGAPGRYGASDANNGGAPGTVADKVAGMGDHRGTAADWLGGTWTPSDNVTVSTQGAAPQGGGASIPALMEAMSDPYASEAQKSVLGMLLQQQLTAMQPQSEEDMLRLQQLRIQTAEMQNPGKKDPIEVNGVLLDPDTYEPLYDGRTPDAPKNPQIETFYDEATGQQYKAQWDGTKWVPVGGVQAPSSPLVTIGGEGTGQYLYGTDAGVPAGWRVDKETGIASAIPGGPAAVEQEQLAGKGGKKDTQVKLKLGSTLENINLNVAEIEDGGLPVTGVVGDARRTWLGRTLTGDSAVDFDNRTNQITDSAALAEVQNMRDNSPTGGAVGSLTDDERRAIGNSVTAMNSSTSAKEYSRAAKAYRKLALDIAYGEGRWQIDESGNVVSDGATPSAPPPAGTPDDDADLFKKYGIKP